MRNVEIKAKVRSLSEIVSKAKLLSGTDGELIPQHDIFYKSNSGRLKLRMFEDKHAELIQYDRPDTEGPKLSVFTKVNIQPESVEGLKTILSTALGITGEVKKKRQLFMVGQTRVHIDQVENLGDFMELEVVLKDNESLQYGQQIADELMGKLGIEKDDLLPCAYTDLITQKL